MAILVGGIDVVVVVLPILRARVVRRVDVDAIDLARVGERQRLERVVVLAVDNDLVGLVSAALHTAGLPEPRVDGLVVFRHGDQIGHVDGAGLPVVVRVVGSHVGVQVGLAIMQRGDAPQQAVLRRFGGAASGQDLHDVACRDRLAVQPHAFRPVVLEHEPVLAGRGELPDVGGQLRITELHGTIDKALHFGLRGLATHHCTPFGHNTLHCHLIGNTGETPVLYRYASRCFTSPWGRGFLIGHGKPWRRNRSNGVPPGPAPAGRTSRYGRPRTLVRPRDAATMGAIPLTIGGPDCLYHHSGNWTIT